MSFALMRSAAAIRSTASRARPHHARCWRQISSTRSTPQRATRIASVTAAAAITAAGTMAHCSSQRSNIHSSRDLSATPAVAVTPLDSKAGASAAPTCAADSSSAHAALLSFLSSHCRGISLSSSDIELLDSPRSFYSTLLTLTASAQRRIVLSSLYVGTGPDEVRLGLALRERMEQAPELRVECLLDFLRGTRPAASAGQESWAALAPLLSAEVSSRFRLDLLALPPPAVPHQISSLRDWAERRWLTGVKTREARGVHHMKFYVFDDTVILSGANLSDTYFTTRQDRYVLLRSKELADFYVQLQSSLKALPFCQRMTAAGLEATSEATERFGEEHRSGRSEWNRRQELGKQVAALFAPSTAAAAAFNPAHDTIVFPTLQMGTLGVTHDEAITSALFTLATTGRLPVSSDSAPSAAAPAPVVIPPPRSLVVATGYMNLTSAYTRLLLAAPPSGHDEARVRIVAASREANGWWGAKGGGRFVPELYAAAALEFLQQAASARASSRVRLLEWSRSDWSYHAKGLWLSFGSRPAASPASAAASEPGVQVSMVGSPNFGARSTQRDGETSLVMVTASGSDLARRLQREKQRLMVQSALVTLDGQKPTGEDDDGVSQVRAADRPPFWLRLLSKLARPYM